jgi:signal transduction histidine kinase
MSIKLRLGLLLGLLLLVFVFCVLAFRAVEAREIAAALAAARREEAALLGKWLDLRSASLRRFADDALAWEELAAFATAPAARPDWARERLEPSLPDYGVDGLWITGPDGELRHAIARPDLAGEAPPLPRGYLPDLARPQAGSHAYFHPVGAGLLEVRAFPLAVAGAEAPWVFVGRLWDARYLSQLGGLTESEASLGPAEHSDLAPADERADHIAEDSAPIVIQRALPGWDGRAIASLRLRKPAPDLSFRVEADRLKTRVFLVFGLCLIASLAVSLHRWILRPLGWIADSLSRHEIRPIQPLLESRTELTRVARLIVTSFEHREKLAREVTERRHAEAALQRTLEERARLGRDLHDGLIQSIYAAGMGLAAARKRVPDDPAAAERHLAQVAEVLNETIREVRDFITGLEPEAAGLPDLTTGVERLFHTMNADGAARLELAIDESLAARLPACLRTDLLLLLREAISNALRHGRARLLRIRLDPLDSDPALARLAIEDDGAGFDPVAAKRGRGLDNLFARAATHGGKPSLDSRPDQGTRLTFLFPLDPRPPGPTTGRGESSLEGPRPGADADH